MKGDGIERILCSAIWFKPKTDEDVDFGHQPKNVDGGFVVCGVSPHNCFSVVKSLFSDISKFKEKYKEVAQGFVTSDNRFIDRIEAVDVALKSGQIKERGNRMKLFSEDLW
jgi:hypothetical protein